MQIEKIEKWRTSDGEEHSSEEMARQYISNANLIDLLSDHGQMTKDVAQDILNILSGNRPRLREWMDACDAAERASLR